MAAKSKAICLLDFSVNHKPKGLNERITSHSICNSDGVMFVFVRITSLNVIVIVNSVVKAMLAMPAPVRVLTTHAWGSSVWLHMALSDGLYTCNVTDKLDPKKEAGSCNSMDVDSPDIFSDLLSEDPGVAIMEGTTTLSHIQITQANLVLAVEGIRDLLQLQQYLTMLTWDATASSYKLIFYELSGEGVVSSKAPSHWFWLPIERTFHRIGDRLDAYTTDDEKQDNNTSDGFVDYPILHCVYPEDGKTIQKDWHGEEGRLYHVGGELYSQLFGRDALLLSLSVVLLTLPLGRLYFCPIQHPHHPPNVISNSALLCDVKQNIISLNILPRYISEANNASNTSDSLLLVGQYGRLLTISAGEANKPDLTAYSLPGPVVCSMLHGTWLIHSTGRDVLWTDVGSLCSDKTTRGDILPTPASLTCGLHNISSLSRTSLEAEAWLGADSVEVIASTVKRKLLLTVLHPSTRVKACRTRQGKVIKDLMACINHVSKTTADLQNLIDIYRVVCNQLAVCGAVASCGCGDDGLNTSQSPIICKVTLKTHESDRHDVYADVEVVNRSSFSLHHGWSLMVDVTSGSLGSNPHIFSFSLANLLPGTCHNARIKLRYDDIRSMAVTLSCSAMFSPSVCFHHLCQVIQVQPNISLDYVRPTDSIAVPLHQQHFDAIHFLSPRSQPLSSSFLTLHTTLKTSALEESQPTQDARDLVRSICRRRRGTCRENGGVSSSLDYKINVTVSAINNDKLYPGYCVEAMTLASLMADNSRHRISKQQMRVVGVSPAGDTVSIQARQDLDSEEKLINLTVSSPSTSLTCLLSQALTRRNTIRTRSSSSTSVSLSSLQKALQKMEEAKQKLVALSDDIQDASKLVEHPSRNCIFSLYQNLRESSSLFLMLTKK